MGNRKLYDSRSFDVSSVRKHSHVWHLVGKYAPNCVRSKHTNRAYLIRVVPDPRWEGVTRVSFHEERIYESESIIDNSHRYVYGSDQWYISPFFEGSRHDAKRDKFSYEDFEVERAAQDPS